MTAVQTLRETKAERLTADLALRNRIETDEPKETPQEWHRRWCRESKERRNQAGLPEESALTMEEIVAIVKEVRTEMYEEEQKIANRR
jgi:hypothetical protein